MLGKACISISLLLCNVNMQMQIRNVHSSGIKLTQRNNHANISELLDNLLRGYDNSVRPDFGGPPAEVEVDIMVRSMGPISEVDMTYSMDCYFRQSWVDKRLAFEGAQDTLALSISMLARIWKPDTYFSNGKQSYLHTITTPNKFVRIYQDGRVLYSSRNDIVSMFVCILVLFSVYGRWLYCILTTDSASSLTIKAGCPMNLEDFPMDIQRCPLKFGSFGYTTNDVIYRWNKDRQAVAIADDMKLSQFDLVDCPAGNSTDTVLKTPSLQVGNHTPVNMPSQYSMLMVDFHLQRHMGNFLIQVYGPCCLLVVLSWVSFWLNREATADRVSLGITTVLTMTFLGLEARTDLPKVPYPTALDFFVFLSFAFIFATIIQFAVVHYFTKYGSGECYFIVDDFGSGSESDEEDTTLGLLGKIPPELNDSTDTNFFEVIPLAACSVPMTPLKDPPSSNWCPWTCFRRKKTTCQRISTANIETTRKRLSFHQTTPQELRKRRRHEPRFNSVSKIDRASRIVFPLLFLVINIFYWYAYLARSSRWLQGPPANI